jgi:hemerythrin-like domain-containing protein
MKKPPIKRNENIVKLSKDHHASLMFCWKLRQGIKHHVDEKRMIAYVEYFWNQHFAEHFREEEDILFAPLHDDLVKKAVADHRQVQVFIKTLRESTEKDPYATLATLADLVDEHVRYEERVLFPHLEKELSENQLEEIGKQLPDDAIKDNYEDAFWIRDNSL